MSEGYSLICVTCMEKMVIGAIWAWDAEKIKNFIDCHKDCNVIADSGNFTLRKKDILRELKHKQR